MQNQKYTVPFKKLNVTLIFLIEKKFFDDNHRHLARIRIQIHRYKLDKLTRCSEPSLMEYAFMLRPTRCKRKNLTTKTEAYVTKLLLHNRLKRALDKLQRSQTPRIN